MVLRLPILYGMTSGGDLRAPALSAGLSSSSITLFRALSSWFGYTEQMSGQRSRQYKRTPELTGCLWARNKGFDRIIKQ